ncbi:MULTISPECIES: hypothetical protein, partial [unclassified Burkholderia]|uniref:hypothetical protein n=1 Tax=unclassified Burkholderia TaxID=2613784 RepID=UPI00075D1076
QQQRSEIMNRLFQLVNNFLNCFVATAGVQLRVRRGSTTALVRTASLLLPRCVSVSAKEA